MQQRWWLWLICLLAYNFNGQMALGQTQGSYHEASGFYHEGQVRDNHEDHEGNLSSYHEGHEDHEGNIGSYHKKQESPLLWQDHEEYGKGYGLTLYQSPGGLKRPVPFLTPADSFQRDRFWVATGITAVLYTGTVIALNKVWYSQYPRSSFHLFDDSGEWHSMDKMGHMYTAYFESLWGYKVARWTGMSDKSASWTGAVMGLIFQSTVEVLDGFSDEWGFSLSDMGFNILGAGVFLAQQRGWGEQRICIKVSSTPITYSATPITSTDGEAFSSLRRRTDDLFGTGYAERFLKDYNAQTTWLSVNVHAFLHPESRFPKWLNIAFGYGAENMYGGFSDVWKEQGAEFEFVSKDYPRYSQFYLSPDIDFTRIPSRSPLIRTLLGIMNVFKMPGPVLEMNRKEGVKVRLRW